MDLMREKVNLLRENPPQFSLLLGVRELRHVQTLHIDLCETEPFPQQELELCGSMKLQTLFNAY